MSGDTNIVHGNSGTAAVRAWLYLLCGLVFAMVIVGGATRLTDSGLSITEWRPIVGMLPPLSAGDWSDAFERYKKIPEYTVVNEGMSLDQFKTIFWWEWGHRFLGRFIGFAFLFPFVWFVWRGTIVRADWPKYITVFVLGGLQGGLGWYMVSSGLVDRIDVSQYRLAAHLGLAVLIFGYIFWLALSLPAASGAEDGRKRKINTNLKISAVILLLLVFVQILLGALVAGMHAGQAYNTWPLMDGDVIPTGLLLMQPWYLNLFENALTVQFDHRLAAYLVLVWCAGHVLALMRLQSAGAASAGLLLVAVLVQLGLGVAVLVMHVPIGLGLFHQAGAVVVFAAAVFHLHRLTET